MLSRTSIVSLSFRSLSLPVPCGDVGVEAAAGPPAVGCGVEVCAEEGPAAAFTGANCVAGTVLDDGVAATGFVEVMGFGGAWAKGEGWVCGIAAGCCCA